MQSAPSTVTLAEDGLTFSFPQVHPAATTCVDFMRTLRIPDDGNNYPLPPGLGSFPLRHIESCAGKVPPAWQVRGGIVLPMYQAEAMWLNFNGDYPCAIKIAAGKINAITGKPWRDGLAKKRQNYVVVPEQPWLDGFCVAKGIIRQFVAMPLGTGYSAEEQLTGAAHWGGLQIEVFPMKREVFRRLFEDARRLEVHACAPSPCAHDAMGLAPGGRMQQEIDADPYGVEVWDTDHRLRCFVHIVNSMNWRELTGEAPPHQPPTAADYTRAGLPWFDYYAENALALAGAARLATLKSVETLAKEKRDGSVTPAASCQPAHVVPLGPKGVSQGHW